MIYKIVSPFQYEIEGDNYTDAIKDFIKFNHEMRIRQMMFMDGQKYRMANMKYYQQNQRNKVGIDTYPLNYIPIINKNMPYPMFIKLKKEEDSKKDESEKKEEKKEEKELSHKIVVPTPLPQMYPYTRGPTPMVPVVYNVYKND
jgi:hypothetical protein